MLMTKSKLKTFTYNEVNNIIYLCFKYTFKLEKPKNNEIQQVLLEIMDDIPAPNIIDNIFTFMENNYPGTVDNQNPSDQKGHMLWIIEEFQKLPFSIRDDLGVDSESEDFIIKH